MTKTPAAPITPAVSGNAPVLYLNNPNGVDFASRENMLKHLKALHATKLVEERAHVLPPLLAARVQAPDERASKSARDAPGAMNVGDDAA